MSVYSIFILGVIIVLIEGMVIQTGILHDLYIGNVIMVISIFCFCIKNKAFGKNSLLEIVGNKYSLWIYILHPLVGNIICKTFHFDGYIFKWLMPILILFATVGVSALIVFAKRIKR